MKSCFFVLFCFFFSKSAPTDELQQRAFWLDVSYEWGLSQCQRSMATCHSLFEALKASSCSLLCISALLGRAWRDTDGLRNGSGNGNRNGLEGKSDGIGRSQTETLGSNKQRCPGRGQTDSSLGDGTLRCWAIKLTTGSAKAAIAKAFHRFV